MSSQTVITARRALGLSKLYIAGAFFMSILALTVWNVGIYSGISGGTNATATNSSAALNATLSASAGKGIKSSLSLLSIPLYMIPIIMLVTSITILFVYDKGNGVFEYLLSIGMTQRDIYMRYLKASVLICVAYLTFFVPADIILYYVVQGAAGALAIIPVLALTCIISVSTITFMIMLMMAFSSLQKMRAGSNQPLAVLVGFASTIPIYIIPIVFHHNVAFVVDFAEAVVITIVALALLFSSERLIRREKLLP